MSDTGSPYVFLIAGEPSGDALGAPMLARLQERYDDLRMGGVGGDGMAAQGLKSLFPMEDLSVMGLTEILPRLPLLIRRIGETVREIERTRPDVIVTIDSPDFTHRVAKKVRHLGIPIIHYVAPTVWAWRPGRARKLANLVDHVMTLFPFEPPYFEAEGLGATFVGHPVVEQEVPTRSPATASSDELRIAMLPGSRRGEVERLLPVFGAALGGMARQPELPTIGITIPTLQHLEPSITQLTRDWPISPTIETRRDAFFDVLQQSNLALCASGTVVLELARANLPSVVAYRVNPLTAVIARRLIKLDHVSLVNIIAGREVMPEYIQDACTGVALAQTMTDLANSPEKRRQQQEAFGAVMEALGQGAQAPSARAADVVADFLDRATRSR